MNEAFTLDHQPLLGDARFHALAVELDRRPRIDSNASFNDYGRAAVAAWRAHCAGRPIGSISSRFTPLMSEIEAGGPHIIWTGWGGVVVTLHEHPRVEKFLVIRQGGYLALEKHERKDEHLEVREGAGLLLWRRTAGRSPCRRSSGARSFTSLPALSIASSAPRTCSSSSAPSTPREWTTI
jgi:hypothetical protein